MKLKIARPRRARLGEINYSFGDRFTLVHFTLGFFYAAIGLPFVIGLGLAVLWELVENPLKVYAPKVFPNATADTLQNSLGDTLAVCCGWWVFSIFA
jgi:hypothetical protein